MAWVEQRGTHHRVRYRTPDGTVGTDSSHPTRGHAELRCKQVDIDQVTDTYDDPALGRITLSEWVQIWEPGHIAGEAKWAAYRSHLLPRYGDVPINKITRQSVKAFVKHLKKDLADSSVASVMSLFGLLRREAVADKCIGHNPCQGVRIMTRQAPERPHATAQQVNTIAARVARRSDEIITAAYTGMRWGEIAGLAKTNTHLGDGHLTVHPDVGALHEIAGNLYLGPPKTAGSARDIHLPEFLIDLLQEVIDSHDHDQVFCGARGALLRRSSMSRRVFRPAADGDPRARTGPVIAGMHFHDLRHTHKTWLIEDDIPEIAQAKTPRPHHRRRPRHLQPRHPYHDRPHHHRPAGPMADHPTTTTGRRPPAPPGRVTATAGSGRLRHDVSQGGDPWRLVWFSVDRTARSAEAT